MKRLLVVLALLAGCNRHRDPPPPPARVSDTERTHARADLAALRAKADEDDAARRRAVTAAQAGAVAPAPGPCPVSAQDLLGEYDLNSSMRSALTVRALGITELFVDGKASSEGPARKQIDAVIQPIERRIDGDLWSGETPATFLDRITKTSLPPHALSLVITDLRKPEATGERKFIGGSVRGRLFLWSYAERRNVCAAALEGENADSVTVRGSGAIPAAALLDSALLGNLIVPAIARASERLAPLPAARP